MTAKAYPSQFFAPGGPVQGERVQVELRSRALVVHPASGPEHEAPYAAMRSRAGGWNGGTLVLEWETDTGTAALLFTADVARVVSAAAPEALRPILGSAPPRSRRGLAIFLGGFAAVLVVAVVLLVAFAGRLTDAAVRRIPPAWEAELGAALAEQSVGGRKAEAERSARFVREVAVRLAAEVESPYTFHVHLVEDAQVNAMAFPGGHIVFFTGLLRAAEAPEEVAGVLAHEMQHVVRRHSLRALVRSLGWRALLATLFGGPGDATGWVVGAAESFVEMRYSRQQETEADLEGARLLQRAGIPVEGLARFFEKLSEASEIPALLSTHPASADRAQRIRALAGPSSGPPLDVDWPAIRAELDAAVER